MTRYVHEINYPINGYVKNLGDCLIMFAITSNEKNFDTEFIVKLKSDNKLIIVSQKDVITLGSVLTNTLKPLQIPQGWE